MVEGSIGGGIAKLDHFIRKIMMTLGEGVL